MRSGITISVSAADRRRLEAIVADRNTSQKHAWRARIILLTSDGVGTTGVMTLTGKSKTTVWRWQERWTPARSATRQANLISTFLPSSDRKASTGDL